MSFKTNIGGKFAIGVTSLDPTVPDPQNQDLDQVAFEALTFQDVPNMGTHGDTGASQDTSNYPTWDRRYTIQQKGQATGAQSEIVFADAPSDGMTALLVAAGVSNNDNFATRITYSNGDIEYNRGIITAPTYGKGAGGDFSTVSVTFAANQEPVKVSAP